MEAGGDVFVNPGQVPIPKKFADVGQLIAKPGHINPDFTQLVHDSAFAFKGPHIQIAISAIEGIIEQSGTPYFCFKDLDENKPSGSIKIRVETIDYFLRRYRDEVIRRRKAEEEIDAQLAALETELRGPIASQPIQGEPEVQEMAAD